MPGELILIVDDEELIRTQAQSALKRFNYQTLIAANANEALQILRKTPTDLMLSDIRMPDMDGLQLFGAAKQLQPDLVVVLMTAHGSVDTVLKALQLGIHGFLQKPFTGSELERAIQGSLLKERAAQDASRFRVLTPILETQRLSSGGSDFNSYAHSLVQMVAREGKLDYCALFTAHSGSQGGGLSQEALFSGPEARSFSPQSFPAIKIAQRVFELERPLTLRRNPSQDTPSTSPEIETPVPGIVLGVPLSSGGKTFGTLLVGRVDLTRSFSAGERNLIELMAGQAANRAQAWKQDQELKEREERLTNFAGKFTASHEKEIQGLGKRVQEEVIPLLVNTRQSIQSYLTKVRPPAAGDLLKAEEKVHSAINEARNLLNALVPTNLTEFGLGAAIRKYLREIGEGEGGCKATYRLEGPELPRLNPVLEITLYRAIQIAVSNACRYSGDTTLEVAVRVPPPRTKPQIIQIEVWNKGKEPPKPSGKNGNQEVEPPDLTLQAIEERINLLGGSFKVEKNSDKGTTVTIRYELPSYSSGR